MRWLADWVHDLIVVVFFVSVAYMLLPENELRPYARLVLGLVVIAALLGPTFELLRWEPQLLVPPVDQGGDAADVVAQGRLLAQEAQRRLMEEGRARAFAHVASVAELALGDEPAGVDVVWADDGGLERVRIWTDALAEHEVERATRIVAGLLGLRFDQVEIDAAAGQGGAGR